jgi:hypothetical protein
MAIPVAICYDRRDAQSPVCSAEWHMESVDQTFLRLASEDLRLVSFNEGEAFAVEAALTHLQDHFRAKLSREPTVPITALKGCIENIQTKFRAAAQNFSATRARETKLFDVELGMFEVICVREALTYYQMRRQLEGSAILATRVPLEAHGECVKGALMKLPMMNSPEHLRSWVLIRENAQLSEILFYQLFEPCDPLDRDGPICMDDSKS